MPVGQCALLVRCGNPRALPAGDLSVGVGCCRIRYAVWRGCDGADCCTLRRSAEINRQLSGRGDSLRDAVVAGAKSQVRPMFMLIVVAMLGMIPAAMATGMGSDIQRPLATVIVGGLASTLVLCCWCSRLSTTSRPDDNTGHQSWPSYSTRGAIMSVERAPAIAAPAKLLLASRPAGGGAKPTLPLARRSPATHARRSEAEPR
jgi:hypothetical protein